MKKPSKGENMSQKVNVAHIKWPEHVQKPLEMREQWEAVRYIGICIKIKPVRHHRKERILTGKSSPDKGKGSFNGSRQQALQRHVIQITFPIKKRKQHKTWKEKVSPQAKRRKNRVGYKKGTVRREIIKEEDSIRKRLRELMRSKVFTYKEKYLNECISFPFSHTGMYMHT